MQGCSGPHRPRWAPYGSLLQRPTPCPVTFFLGHWSRSRTTSQGNIGGHLTSPGLGFPSCLCVANLSLPICGCQDDLSHARQKGEAACRHCWRAGVNSTVQVTETRAPGKGDLEGPGPATLAMA